MNRRIWLCLGTMSLLLLLGCGTKLMIPPKVDLIKYNNVGIVGFTCDAEGNMDEYITEKFLQKISGYQKKANILNLGTWEEVLKSVQAEQMNREAIQAVGRKYNVNAVILGKVNVADVKLMVEIPSVKGVGGMPREDRGWMQLEGMRVNAGVRADITVELCETNQGDAVWTGSATGKETVKQVRVLHGGKIVFDADDPGDAYVNLVRPLVKKVSDDFKTKHKRISK